MVPKNTQDVDNFITFGVVNTFRYTNHKGETRMRRVIPLCLRFGTSLDHPQDQWLLECMAVDCEGGTVADYRTFALSGIHPR
jgi:hypothetical protein